MRRYTILHTIETGGPGGAETVLLNLASGLDTTRFRSLVLLPRDGWLRSQLVERGVETHLLTTPGHTGPIRDILRLAHRERVDLIHAHLPDQNFYAAVAGALSHRPTVVTYHGDLQLTGPGCHRRGFKRWFVRRGATMTVAVSQYLRESLLQARFPSVRTTCIYNGIDTSRFTRALPCNVRAELGCADRVPLVGMVANLRGSKNYEVFVQAAALVASVFGDARFVAVGDIDTQIGARVSALLNSLSLTDKFILLGFRSDIPEVLAALDVFVLSSTHEGFSIATVEAMAAAKPVVVTRSGGPQEIVESGRTGVLVAPNDPNALAEAICGILGQPDRAAFLASNARASVEARFSIARMMESYEQLYARLLGFEA